LSGVGRTAVFVQRTPRIAYEEGTTAERSSGERVAAGGAFELLAPAGD
jgi:hypothetical protein